jgi:hypothetical protein
MDCGSRKKRKAVSDSEPAAPSDSRVGKVVKVVVSDRKKKSPAKKTAVRKTSKKAE